MLVLDGSTAAFVLHAINMKHPAVNAAKRRTVLMAGDRSLRKEFNHRQGIDLLRAAQPLREVVNRPSV